MEKEKQFITSFMIAVSNCSLYSRNHEAFDDLAKGALSVLAECLTDHLELMIIDNELIINKVPFRDRGVHAAGLVKRFRKKGISRADFLKGVTLSEMKEFIAGMAAPGTDLRPLPHIVTGTVDVAMTEKPSGEEMEGFPVSGEQEKVKEIFHAASPFKQLNLVGLDEIVGHFVTTLRNESSILRLLCPVKSFDEYTYTHATNVAVLSVFQAETLGIDEDLQHEIGISGLLHDAGKLFVPREILEKKGKLDEREFAEIKKHPLFGARYLAGMTNLPRIAPVIAFEHHMKYDGSGYPQLTHNGRKQHIFSQITAVADFFDALRSNRPYRAGMDVQEICVLLQKGSGRDFNPFLVDNFVRSLRQAIAA